MNTLHDLTENCLSKEFEKRIEETIFKPLQPVPTASQLRDTKVLLQDLFHNYRRRNADRCFVSAFHAVHRCVYHVYIDAYERLTAIQTVPDPISSFEPRRTRRNTPRPPKLTDEELASQVLKEIEDAGSNIT